MRNRGRLAILCACGAIVPCVRAVQYDVYILTGQSNSLGTTGSGDTLPLPGSDPTDADTKFFWSNVSASNTIYPPVLYGNSAGAITPLQIQEGDGSANPNFWGPEFGFARTMAKAGSKNILLIKASRGGGSNALWDKTTFEASNNDGHMWGHVQGTVDAALGVLVSQGNTFDIKGLVYLQGESNTTADAGIADTRLADLLSNLKSHIAANYPGTTDHTYNVIAEIAASQSTSARITTTAKQLALADTRADVAFVSTRDQSIKSDGIHFGGNEKLEVGRRIADAMNSRTFTESANLIAGYSAAAANSIPHPSAQGWTEAGRVTGVTMAGATVGGTAAWQLIDNSSTANPEYRQALGAAEFKRMFDEGWTFRVNAKVAAGGGLAVWSITPANDPGWNLSGARYMNGFQLDRVNTSELQIKLWNNPLTINLGAGSADVFHTLELRGQPKSPLFDLVVDGVVKSSNLDLRNGTGLAGFDNIALFNSGSTGGVSREVDWNLVTLTVPEPASLSLLAIGSQLLLRRRRPQP